MKKTKLEDNSFCFAETVSFREINASQMIRRNSAKTDYRKEGNQKLRHGGRQNKITDSYGKKDRVSFTYQHIGQRITKPSWCSKRGRKIWKGKGETHRRKEETKESRKNEKKKNKKKRGKGKNQIKINAYELPGK